MLKINNIAIEYKSKKDTLSVIKNLSFHIEEGDCLAILGPSGCGKSTLIQALSGNIHMKEGCILFQKDGREERLNPKQHKIGLIPQNYGLLPWKSLEKNCLLPLKIRKEKISDHRNLEIKKVYESLGLSTIIKKYPHEVSGGQLQRAAVARALILKPDLLLMDEPFSALDEITKEEARELFLKVWKENRSTTILVTHNIEEALYLGNRIIVMSLEGGSFLYDAKNPYFGIINPSDVEYLNYKNILRERLRTKGGRYEKIHETN